MDDRLNFKCDYANAVLDKVWKDAMRIVSSHPVDVKVRVFIGRLERRALESWLKQRGGYASMLTLPGCGGPNDEPSIFGFPLTFVNMNEHIAVRRIDA